MKLVLLPLAAALVVLATASMGYAQQPPVPRLPVERLDVLPPSERVRGEPGALTLQNRTCPTVAGRDVRRHIVNVVVQEWAYFGFSVLDETDPASWVRPRRPPSGPGPDGLDFDAWRTLMSARIDEAVRVAPSIAGYWAATPEGDWIVDRQNAAWTASGGAAVRWVDPWSAAFVSWVMCEAGLVDASEFRRAVAHHVYIDQAIRARDGEAPEAAFVAYDLGEAAIVPGDLLCLARRPAYRTLAERRAQLGAGARTHCDVVVKVDEERELLIAIGGNVRGTVGLKLLPAERVDGAPLRPVDRSRVVSGARSAFAHLKLRADPIEPSAFDQTPTMAAVLCNGDAFAAEEILAARLLPTAAAADRC